MLLIGQKGGKDLHRHGMDLLSQEFFQRQECERRSKQKREGPSVLHRPCSSQLSSDSAPEPLGARNKDAEGTTGAQGTHGKNSALGAHHGTSDPPLNF